MVCLLLRYIVCILIFHFPSELSTPTSTTTKVCQYASASIQLFFLLNYVVHAQNGRMKAFCQETTIHTAKST